MGYPECAAALEEILHNVVGLSEENVSRGDYRILARGTSIAVVLMQGRFREHQKSDDVRYRTVWQINVEMFVGFSVDKLTLDENIEEYRQSIMDMVDKYPTLNSTAGVVFAGIIEGDEPSLWDSPSKMWWKQTLVCEIEERNTVTYATGG